MKESLLLNKTRPVRIFAPGLDGAKRPDHFGRPGIVHRSKLLRADNLQGLGGGAILIGFSFAKFVRS